MPAATMGSPASPSRGASTLRTIAAIAAVLVALATAPPLVEVLHRGRAAEPVAWTSEMKDAYTLRIQLSENAFQLALVFVAGLWGLLFSGEERAQRTFAAWTERTMLVACSATLLSSAWWHYRYVAALSSYMTRAGADWAGRVPALDSGYAAAALHSQVVALTLGVAVGAAAVACGLWGGDGGGDGDLRDAPAR